VKIIYIARHGQTNSNDDEGAIQHALQELGHHVVAVREIKARNAVKLAKVDRPDLVLFHHWDDVETLKEFGKVGVPRVFWYFDLVDYPKDQTLAARCRRRVDWMHRVVPNVELGFCTDGDWVDHWSKTGAHGNKLVRLNQGADVRKVGVGEPGKVAIPILFTGIARGGGVERESFVREMMRTYGGMFRWVEKGTHGREMASLVASSMIVVAPDSPVTDRYWSNRVYNALGFGAFLLHPYSACLTHQYEHCRELIYYRSREDLHDKIRYYLSHPEDRQTVAARGYARTVREHTYTHRVKKLVQTVVERGLAR
jgi:hypothetical protein